MRFFLVFTVILATFNAAAEVLSEEPLASILQGSYYVSGQVGAPGSYLNCKAGNVVDVSVEDDAIRLKGLTHSPIAFQDINKGPIGIPGPLIGFSQRRTTFKEVSPQHYQLLSEHRDCEPLLSNIGCFGKKWRTTASVVFFIDTNDSTVWTVLDFLYQPFENVEKEICQLQQSPRSIETL